jgi:hypothetical protein
MRAGSDFGNSPVDTTDPTPIAAGEPFIFSGYYGDSRMAQNRTCVATGVFTPQAGHRYRALLVVEGQVTSCKLGVYDATSGKPEQIPMSMPKVRPATTAARPIARTASRSGKTGRSRSCRCRSASA